MKLCSVCNKNVAVIFTSKIVEGKSEVTGLCIQCAKKMGVPILDQLMKQSGIKEEELESMAEQMNGLFQDLNPDDLKDNPLMSLFENPFSLMKNEENSTDIDSIDNLQDFQGTEDVSEINKSEINKSEINKNNNEKEMEGKKGKKSLFKKKKYLDMYGINLTFKAYNNEVDRIIGREKEIDRIIQILNRRTKNNPILIGEPGVGKTAIAEGLALRIVEKQVPTKLFNSEVYLLDLTSILAGTQFRGQFESRMKGIIDEAKSFGNIILVIDEIHNLIGAGEVNGGAMSAANILKPSLARGEIQVIGATTIDEYRKHVEKDAALERRFQPVHVEEPTVEETIDILRGIKGYYEAYHEVHISDEVLISAANLSQRYITDRFLPDKAIDVIDEAGSRANLKNKGLIEIETLREATSKLEENMKEAASKEDYEKVAVLRMEEIKLKENMEKAQLESREAKITLEDIGSVIEAWTKIPVQKITQEEAEKLLNLEEKIHNRVIGQEKAVVSLSRAIRRSRSGFKKKKRPSSFVFVGPTGVGKTELVKAIAVELFGSEEALIRIDMSEYMEKHTVSKLIGAPPGYVGYDEAGQLTEKVRRRPYSVILLDEIEKAHPDVFNILLQILEDGRLTDSQGRTVYFDNTVIVMTSNAGTNFKALGMGFAKEEDSKLEQHVKDALKETFKPEFLNRIDDIIVFSHLTKEELYKIIDLMLKEVSDEVKEKGMTIEFSKEVKDFILKEGYDEKYGARPLRRAIQKYLEDELSEQFLMRKFQKGDHIKVELIQGKIELR